MGDEPVQKDFRSERMPTSEGRDRARSNWRRAWDAYEQAVNKAAAPVVGQLVRPIAAKVAGATTVDLAGFWLAWHLEGGFEGLQRIGMSRASVFRRVALFRKVFGAHPDEFDFPGVTIDVDTYLRGAGPRLGPRDTHPEWKSQD